MFSVGQKVWHRNGQRSGTVLDTDGDRVYIQQENGAELDFPASELSAAPPGDARGAGAKLRDSRAEAALSGHVTPNRVLTAGDITPDHARVLEIIPLRTVRAVAALYEKRAKAERRADNRFSALDVAGKLNVITAITAVPYRTMREYRDQPGELGLLMGKGLADSLNTG